MIDSFKNFERFRYKINIDIDKKCTDIKKTIEDNHLMLLDETYSIVASFVASYFFSSTAISPFKDYLKECLNSNGNDWISISIDLIAGLLGIIVILLLSIAVYKIVLKIRKKRKICGPEGIDGTDYVKKFDNIACDSIIVSLEYLEKYRETQNPEEKTLYFFESLHYLEQASEITDILSQDKNNIKSDTNVRGVYTFRINNICSMIQNINSALGEESSKEPICGVSKEIEKVLNDINKHHDNISNHLLSI